MLETLFFSLCILCLYLPRMVCVAVHLKYKQLQRGVLPLCVCIVVYLPTCAYLYIL